MARRRVFCHLRMYRAAFIDSLNRRLDSLFRRKYSLLNCLGNFTKHRAILDIYRAASRQNRPYFLENSLFSLLNRECKVRAVRFRLPAPPFPLAPALPGGSKSDPLCSFPGVWRHPANKNPDFRKVHLWSAETGETPFRQGDQSSCRLTRFAPMSSAACYAPRI